MASTLVQLYVYDLTKGLARTMSMPLLGKQIDGVWHTSIVIFGREYFYGGGGVESCPPYQVSLTDGGCVLLGGLMQGCLGNHQQLIPGKVRYGDIQGKYAIPAWGTTPIYYVYRANGGTILGQPDEVHNLGYTEVPNQLFSDYLGGLSAEDFCGEKYNLFDHNCNTFSNEVAQFLTSKHIPSHIIDLPQEVLNTPIGAFLKPIMDSMSANPMGTAKPSEHRPTYDPVIPIPQQQVLDSNAAAATNGITNEATPSSKETAVKDSSKDGDVAVADTAAAAGVKDVKKDVKTDTDAGESGSANGDRTVSEDKESKKNKFLDEELTEEKYQETMRRLRLPISATLVLFKEVNPEACVEAIKSNAPDGLLTKEEITILDSMKVSLIILPDDCFDDPPPPVNPQCFLVIGKLLSLPPGELSPDVLHPLVDCLQLAFLKQDVISLMQENDDHMIMSFVSMCECQTLEVQIAVLRMLCNICSCWKGYHWLTSIIEWVSHIGEQTSNSKIVSSLTCNCLLTGFDAIVQPAAILCFNISKYTISEDLAIDFACAMYQCLQSDLKEDTVYHCLSGVYNMMKKYSEVASLANIMGLDLARLTTISDKVAKVCQDIEIVIKDK